MKIRILSREGIEKLAQKQFPVKTAVISIADYCYEPADLKYQPDYLLQLAFDDVDADVFADELGKDFAPEDRLAVEAKYHMLSDEQAQKIAEFYRSVRDHVEVLICQCEHGQSRSAAVAAAILEFRSRRGVDVFSNDNYYPNKVVFRRVLAALKDQIPVYDKVD